MNTDLATVAWTLCKLFFLNIWITVVALFALDKQNLLIVDSVAVAGHTMKSILKS